MFLNELILIDLATGDEIKNVDVENIIIKLSPPVMTVAFSKTADRDLNRSSYYALIETVKVNDKRGLLTLFLSSINEVL